MVVYFVHDRSLLCHERSFESRLMLIKQKFIVLSSGVANKNYHQMFYNCYGKLVFQVNYSTFCVKFFMIL